MFRAKVARICGPNMNYKKIWRTIDRGDFENFGPSEAWAVRKAIAESLVVFFTRLKALDSVPESGKPKDHEKDPV